MNAQRRVRTRIPVLLALVVVALVGAITVRAVPDLAPAPASAAPADDEAAFVAALNQVRAGVGLPPLQVDPELTALARQWARTMADAGHIYHASSLSAGVTNPWLKLGENVGVGADVQVLVDAFVASPGHYANIVDPAYTRIGVGVVYAGSALYTTHRFMQPADAAPPTTVAPPTTPPPSTTSVPPPPDTSSPPTTGTAAPAAPPSPPAPPRPATTTTTLPPPAAVLPAPPGLPERVVVLLSQLDAFGT